MDIVNEGSAFSIQVTFRDQDGNAIVPTSIQYRIDNEDGTELKGATSVSPASTVEILITENETRILDPRNGMEKRYLLIEFTYGTKKGKELYVFGVRNLTP